MPKGIKRIEGIQVVIAVLPSGRPGASKRLTLDLETPPALFSFQVGEAAKNLLKKTQPKIEKAGSPAAA